MDTLYTEPAVLSNSTTRSRSNSLSLQPVETVNSISPKDFKENYFNKRVPLVIKDMAKQWPAYDKWNWDYFKNILGDKKVGIYNNTKSDAYSPVNTADDYTTLGNYIDMICNGPSEWRIFLFNMFKHAPFITKDFSWPAGYMSSSYVKSAPMLFIGGQGSVTHLHFDMDLSHLFHTQFAGRKKVLLFPFEEQYKLYRKPFEVLSLVDFTNYDDPEKSHIDYDRFPAVKEARGYSLVLEHGDTLFMPSGYWHHMEYIESGFAMSLRALEETLPGKIRALWYLLGMRNVDTVMKKTFPIAWYNWKERKIFEMAEKAIAESPLTSGRPSFVSPPRH